MKTDFSGRMNEVDAANMKANLMEIHFILGMIALMLLLRAAVPDEDKKKNFTYNMLINLISRQQNDMMVFANPSLLEQMNKNILPVMSILSDVSKLGISIKNEFSEVERKRGKSLSKVLSFTPPLGQFKRAYDYGAKEINK